MRKRSDDVPIVLNITSVYEWIVVGSVREAGSRKSGGMSMQAPRGMALSS